MLATAPVAAEPAYPRALVERPLLLPGGLVEGGLALAMTSQVGGAGERVRLGVAAPRVTLGLGGGELEAATTIALGRTTLAGAPDPSRLQALRLAARFAVAPEVAVGGELAYGAEPNPFGVVEPHYESRAVIATRLAGARNALELGGLAGIAIRPRDAADPVVWALAGARVRVRAQLAATVAVEGRATLRYLRDFAATTTETRNRLAQDYGLGALWSIAPQLDALAAIELVTLTTEETRVIVGVQLRSAP